MTRQSGRQFSWKICRPESEFVSSRARTNSPRFAYLASVGVGWRRNSKRKSVEERKDDRKPLLLDFVCSARLNSAPRSSTRENSPYFTVTNLPMVIWMNFRRKVENVTSNILLSLDIENLFTVVRRHCNEKQNTKLTIVCVKDACAFG